MLVIASHSAPILSNAATITLHVGFTRFCTEVSARGGVEFNFRFQLFLNRFKKFHAESLQSHLTRLPWHTRQIVGLFTPTMADLQMQDAAHEVDVSKGPSFSEEEKEILELYDQVQRLELELALAKARTRLAEEAESRGGDDEDEDDNGQDEDDPDRVEEARNQLLEAMSLYTLRNGVVNNVIITNPLLKGIHGSTAASPIEQDILPWVQARDTASRDVAAQSTTAKQVLAQLTDAESEALRAARRNRELAAEVLRLAREADRGRVGGAAGAGGDQAAGAQIAELEGKLAASRRKWRVMKGTASGIVAGSGVDWAADPELRDVVLDPE